MACHLCFVHTRSQARGCVCVCVCVSAHGCDASVSLPALEICDRKIRSHRCVLILHVSNLWFQDY